VKETFRPLSLPFRKRLITQIPYLIQISNFRQPLRFANHPDPLDAVFTVNFTQLRCSLIENVALANVNLLVWLQLQRGNQFRHDPRGFLQVFFFSEKLRLEKLDVNKPVLELAGFKPKRAYHYAEKQVAAACIIYDNRHLQSLISLLDA
jgi:hypothetical protein